MSEYNFLKTNGFSFDVARIRETTYRVVDLSLPDVSISPVQPSMAGGSPQFYPGSAVEYGPMTVVFQVDENLDNYIEILRWISQQNFPGTKEFNPESDLEIALVADIVVTTLTNNSNPNRVFVFKNAFPVSLSGFNMSTIVGDSQIVTCTTEFRFSHMEVR